MKPENKTQQLNNTLSAIRSGLVGKKRSKFLELSNKILDLITKR